MTNRTKDTLLLVGDQNSDRQGLRDIFESRFYLLEAESDAQARLLLQQNAEYIAAVITDIPLSEGETIQALAAACQQNPSDTIPLIAVIQPAGNGENEEYAFILGASDVVRKPYTPLSIQRRVQVLVDLYLHQRDLEQLAQKQRETIQQNHQIMIDTLSSIIEYRSNESGYHVLRIRRFTNLLLHALAQRYPEYHLDETTIDIITSAAALHDIGKISIPDSILNKPGKLTPGEFEIMKTHTTVGSQLVEGLKDMGDTSYLRYIYNIALYHHERWDGGGYPQGLQGDEIPICAQVVGLTDAFDALTTPRAYKAAYPYHDAVSMILNGECGAFSPKLLECFKRVREDMIALAKQYADGYSPKADHIRMPLPGPEKKNFALSALQLSQQKYQSLLHYLNATVIEMDLDDRIYHVVYNPNPDFLSLFAGTSFENLSQKLFQDVIHPEDIQDVTVQYGMGMLRLFRQGGRSHSFQCRIFSPPHQTYQPYRVTLQRIFGDDPDQRLLLVIFQDTSSEAAPPARTLAKSLLDSPALYDLRSAAICCFHDDLMTIREGAESLTALTQFPTPVLWTQFHGSLLELALPEDRPLLREKLGDLHIRSGRMEFDFRLQCKDTPPLWVQCRSRCSVGPDGTAYLYHTLTDISRLKTQQHALEASLCRSDVLLNQSGSIVFEWDLTLDRIRCSDAWQARFGYPIQPEHFTAQLASATHFHPDDLPLLRDKVRAMTAGRETDVIDLRIANNERRYFWSRIRATTIRDSQGHASHVIGIIYDIDQLKTDALSMQLQAQRDPLTRLLNKTSTQEAISSYLQHRNPARIAAMLVLDLDNFKAVNDRLGHLYGDAVLTQVGSTLKNLFRSQDVVGRIGGDEFMILLKDVPNPDIVRDRCQLLVDTFQTQLRTLMPQLPVSVSVGAAIIPQHGIGYADLYRHADEALYSAKRRGKNQYCIYDPREQYTAIADPGAQATQIDSDLRGSVSDDSIAQFVFYRLYESRDIAATIDELLGFIGTHFNVSRVYVFENNEENTACSNTFEWCNVGIQPQIHNLQNMSYETDIPGWPNLYRENGILYCMDISQLEPTARSVVEPQGIKSMLHCAIMDQGIFRGFVGFDECTSNHLWTQGQVTLLKLLSGILCMFITKLRSQQQGS